MQICLIEIIQHLLHFSDFSGETLFSGARGGGFLYSITKKMVSQLKQLFIITYIFFF